MNQLNSVIIDGNARKDAEVLISASGKTVCKISIVSNRYFKSGNSSSIRREALFLDIECFGKTAEFCGEKVKKGDAIRICGRLKRTVVTGSDGTNRTSVVAVAEHVQFLPKMRSMIEDTAYSEFIRETQWHEAQKEEKNCGQCNNFKRYSKKECERIEAPYMQKECRGGTLGKCTAAGKWAIEHKVIFLYPPVLTHNYGHCLLYKKTGVINSAKRVCFQFVQKARRRYFAIKDRFFEFYCIACILPRLSDLLIKWVQDERKISGSSINKYEKQDPQNICIAVKGVSGRWLPQGNTAKSENSPTLRKSAE